MLSPEGSPTVLSPPSPIPLIPLKRNPDPSRPLPGWSPPEGWVRVSVSERELPDAKVSSVCVGMCVRASVFVFVRVRVRVCLCLCVCVVFHPPDPSQDESGPVPAPAWLVPSRWVGTSLGERARVARR